MWATCPHTHRKILQPPRASDVPHNVRDHFVCLVQSGLAWLSPARLRLVQPGSARGGLADVSTFCSPGSGWWVGVEKVHNSISKLRFSTTNSDGSFGEKNASVGSSGRIRSRLSLARLFLIWLSLAQLGLAQIGSAWLAYLARVWPGPDPISISSAWVSPPRLSSARFG